MLLINTLNRGLALSVISVFVLLSSCKKESDNFREEKDLFASQSNGMVMEESLSATQSQGMVMEEIVFTAIARIGYCHGEDIRFTGLIENRVKTTTSQSGQTHFVRQFTVRGMTGKGVVTGSGTNSVPLAYTGTDYKVIGGAEMFSIKDPVYNSDGTLNLSGSLTESDIVIHRGTLVFEDLSTGAKVVARHDIQKTPGAGIKQNRWLCGGN
jgi:hypothetical protein